MRDAFRAALVVIACVAVSACDPTPPTAPTITSFTGAPTMLVVGQAVAITGAIGFRDPDADVASAVFAIVDPADVARESPPAPVDQSGLRSGAFPYTVQVTPTVRGPHRLTVRLVDATALSSAVAELALDVE